VTGDRAVPASAPDDLVSAAAGDHRPSDCVQDAAGDPGKETGSHPGGGTRVLGPAASTRREVLP
jgi:hypothetical protein